MYIEKNELGIKTTSVKGWRLFYNGLNVIELAEQDFKISAGGDAQIFVADTKKECEAEIARLKLVKPKYIK
jgi:hypothetical protein